MYLLYDVLQLRRSSLGNAILVKRQDWKSAGDDIASLTVNQLEEAAKAVAEGRAVDNPVIQRLQRNIVTIGMQVPESFSQKLKRRSEIRGSHVRGGMPAFWFTINPSDLRNPLVLHLAGIEYSADALPTATAAIRQATATSNPVAVAQFFHHTCKAIFNGLLGTNTGRIGILGEVANYFGVVETNGRGMLHLHGLVWVKGNLAFRTLRERMLQDRAFATRMIHYLETVICQSVDLDISGNPDTDLAFKPPSAKNLETDHDFHVRLSADSNAVACKTQLHSPNHTATCFKYSQPSMGKRTCRFGMPRDLIPDSKVDDFGVVHLARNHGWVNPWNPAIATCIRSNHDISWIPTMLKALCVTYYITNYATKDDVSPHQILVKAALLKRSIEDAKAAKAPTAQDLRISRKDMDQFSLRCFNTLSHDREISGVQIASSLLQLPNYYTENYNFVQINLWWLRRYVRGAMELIEPLPGDSSDPMGEEHCAYQTGDNAPSSRFDNYKWRGPDLALLSLFEYCMLVQTKRVHDGITADIKFDPIHPKYSVYVQRLACKKSQLMTVTFNGQLSEFQAEEDTVQKGHPDTAAIENDIAEILLGLFVPWHRLPHLFSQHAATYSVKRDACAHIWSIVEPALSPHNRVFASNIELLRKSKEDCQIDAELRRNSNSQDFFDREIDDVDLAMLDSNPEDSSYSLHEELTSESLIAAYHSIALSWHKESLIAAQRIPNILSGTDHARIMQPESLLPLDIFQLPTHASSGLKYFPATTLQQWDSQIKKLAKPDDTDEPVAFDFDDFNLDLGDGILHPILELTDSISNLADRRLQVGENPTGVTLINLISEDIPLNHRQRLLVDRILSHALSWSDVAYDASKRDQMLLYIGGEGGTGKSQMIKAIVAGMDLICRKDEVILMAPTGVAAHHIDGNTYHTSLGIAISQTQRPTVPSRIRRLWSNKTIMIIDEVSMVDLSMLSTIENQCKIARSLDRDSTELFGGLPIIILMGDFHQFPPVRGPALWKEPRKGNDGDAKGQLIWHQFTDVIILDQQMRQAQDPAFRSLLARGRAAAWTEDDLRMLNSKVITSLFTPELANATTVVKRNTLRHHLNRLQIEHFARSRSQRIYVFPALHTRIKSTGRSCVRAEDLLGLQDQSTKIPFPGLFLYTSDMPAMVLTNACTILGQVNGARGIATGIVVDPTGMYFHC